MRYGLAQNAIRLHSHLDSILGSRYNGGGCVVSNAKSKLINIMGYKYNKIYISQLERSEMYGYSR